MPLLRRARPLILLVVSAFATATVIFAFLPHAVAAPSGYVALGDSYSSGVGAGDYGEGEDDGSCMRGRHAYPVLWAKEHPAARFTFVACSGATTEDVRKTQLGALGSDTGLVTISIGGNDVGFSHILSTCKLGSEDSCAEAVSTAEATFRTELPPKLTATYTEIRRAAPRARLVVLGYPRLFETTSCGFLSMSVDNRTVLNRGARLLEGIIRSQAQAAGAAYASVDALFAGHRVCADDPWINGTDFFVRNSYHPTADGYSQGYLRALNAATG